VAANATVQPRSNGTCSGAGSKRRQCVIQQNAEIQNVAERNGGRGAGSERTRRQVENQTQRQWSAQKEERQPEPIENEEAQQV